MRRGSTPTHTFTLPFNTEVIEKLRITYKQQGDTVLTKTEKDVELSEKTIVCELTQEDTLSFLEKVIVEIQLKILTKNGKVYPSDIYRVSPGRVLDEEVL